MIDADRGDEKQWDRQVEGDIEAKGRREAFSDCLTKIATAWLPRRRRLSDLVLRDTRMRPPTRAVPGLPVHCQKARAEVRAGDQTSSASPSWHESTVLVQVRQSVGGGRWVRTWRAARAHRSWRLATGGANKHPARATGHAGS